LHGNGSNRWFDKTMQLVVFDDGRMGFIGEVCSAAVAMQCCPYILTLFV
jgi:hypothetical protein